MATLSLPLSLCLSEIFLHSIDTSASLAALHRLEPAQKLASQYFQKCIEQKTYLLKKLFLFVSTSQVCTNSRSSGPVGQRVYDLELCWALFVSAGCWCLVWAAASKSSSPFPSPSLSICPSFSFEMTHYCHLNP